MLIPPRGPGGLEKPWALCRWGRERAAPRIGQKRGAQHKRFLGGCQQHVLFFLKDLIDFLQNNDNTSTTTRTFFPSMTRKHWITRPDQKEENDKDDNFGQDEAMALSG